MTPLFLLASLLYLGIGGIFAAMSLGELSAAGRRGGLRRLVALAAALLWPLTLLTMMTVALLRIGQPDLAERTRLGTPTDRSASR